ncbi:MAG: stalk domain-containing protein [Armatimonadota bacterium]|nr:stalk domain-containing protein [Armatimonadota bacterium]
MKTRRSVVILVLAAVALAPFSAPLAAQSPPAIRVLVNGDPVAFDVPPTEVGGRLLVPLRGVFERLGATVEWDPGTQRITARSADRTIELVVGQRDAAVNGRPVVLDVPPMLVGGRTMVPLRFVSEALGAYVQWQAETRTVLITVAAAAAPRPPAPAPPAPPTTPAAPQATPTPAPQPTATPGPRITEGVLVAVNTTATPPRIQVGVGNVIHIFVVSPDTAILRTDVGTGAGGSVALAALRVGDQVRVEAPGTSNEAAVIRATFRQARGRVDVMTQTAIALQDGQVIRINGDAAVTLNGAVVPLGDAPARVRRGDEVVVRQNPVTNEAWEIAVTQAGVARPTATPTATPSPAPAAGTVTFVAIADAPLSEAAPNTAHAGDPLWVGREPSGRWRSLVAFNISLPAGSQVRRARLRLFMHGLRSGGLDLYTVYAATRAWRESNATWNARANEYDRGRSSGAVAIAGGTRVFIEWDVTEIVRAWVSGAEPNHGFLIRNLELGTNLLSFANRQDAAANRPRLIVEYGPP